MKNHVAAVFTSNNLYDQNEIVARWADHIERIVVELGHTSIQMQPGPARHLAHQLLAAADAAEGHWQPAPTTAAPSKELMDHGLASQVGGAQ